MKKITVDQSKVLKNLLFRFWATRYTSSTQAYNTLGSGEVGIFFLLLISFFGLFCLLACQLTPAAQALRSKDFFCCLSASPIKKCSLVPDGPGEANPQRGSMQSPLAQELSGFSALVTLVWLSGKHFFLYSHTVTIINLYILFHNDFIINLYILFHNDFTYQ